MNADQLVPPLLDLGVPLLRLAGRLLVGPVADGAEVVDLAVQALQRGVRWSARSTRSVCSFQRWIVTQATKVFFSDESGQWMGRLSYILWTSLKKSSAQPVAEVARSCRSPGRTPPKRRAAARPPVAEAVAAVARLERAVEEEDAVRERVRRSSLAGSRMPSPSRPKRPRATPRAKLRWSVAGSAS